MTKKSSQTYQELSAELDTVMDRLQSDDITIDEAVAAYERGIVIVRELEAYLKDAENKVEKIKADLTKQ